MMRVISIDKISGEECQGIQINGISHCVTINCKWQGLSACKGKNILKTGKNSKGYRIGENGLIS